MTVLNNLFFKYDFFHARLMLGFLFIWASCSLPKNQIEIRGLTMGTTYTIKIIPSEKNVNIRLLEFEVDSILTALNKQMSTWDPNSEISQFNAHLSIEPFLVSRSFYDVVENALSVSERSNGLFDISVYELMEIWGFGPNPKSDLPDADEIESVLIHTGFEKIIAEKQSLQKLDPLTQLDLNAIAKGYGVDEVFNFLESKGYNDIFVEIGGEIKCSGRNQRNKYWSIGIENPTGGNKPDRPFAAIVYADGSAVATSGNYRNIVDLNGEILGHIIHPKTGYPIQTNVLSVTVLANSCMLADAWATALMVMDHNNGFSMVESLPEIEAIWILENGDGTRRIALSTGAKVEDSIYAFKY